MTDEQKRLTRVSVYDLEAVLGIPFQVLDEGFVRVIDYMGSDEAIVQAARISYGKGTKHVHEDRGLIRYLMRHRHSTLFEMCELKLHVRVPMDCWRQWIRHRTANVNEYSTRYSEAIDAAQKTAPDQWRYQSLSNRQGSAGSTDLEAGEILSDREMELQSFAREIYHERLNAGIAREQARKDLPLSTYTESYWKIDLHNLLHFLSVRMDQHAQFEIRRYANVIGHEIVSRWCPLAWEAFLDYQLYGRSFSKPEMAILKATVAGRMDEAREVAGSLGWLIRDEEGWKQNRERREFEAKVAEFGLPVPWHQ